MPLGAEGTRGLRSPGTSRREEASGVKARGEDPPPVVPECRGGQVLKGLVLLAPHPLRPSGVGSGGPWRGELAQSGPQPTQPRPA